MVRRMLLTVFAALLIWQVPPALAQQVYVSTPSINTSGSFYEWFGVDWGYRSRGRHGNFYFNRGSSQGTMPRFGGFDPAAAAGLGFSSGGFFFNLRAAQGSHRSITSTTPSVNVMNGAVGSVRDVQLRPFVTGLIPVVGSRYGARVSPPVLISPLKERLARLRNEQARQTRQTATPVAVDRPDAFDSSDATELPELVLGAVKKQTVGPTFASRAGSAGSTAERGDVSVAEIRRRQAARLDEEAEDLNRLIEEAHAAELVGRFGAARVRYRQAAADATGEQKRELLEKLESIRDR